MNTQFLINGLTTGAVYALIAVGYSLINTTTRIFHIAYAALLAITPYILYTFHIQLNYSLALSALLSLIFVAILSILIEVLVYQPLVKNNSSSNIFMISSIGVMIVVINLIGVFFGNETRILQKTLSTSFEFSGMIITSIQIIQLIISNLILIIFVIYLKKSRQGLMARAYRDDPQLYAVMGLDGSRLRLGLFAISGMMAAIGSGLISYGVGFEPNIGMPLLLNIVVAIVIGGIGRFTSAILGGYILGILQGILLWYFSAQWEQGLSFAILIIFLLFRQDGILGEKRRLV